jgi:hypothetical protein
MHAKMLGNGRVVCLEIVAVRVIAATQTPCYVDRRA